MRARIAALLASFTACAATTNVCPYGSVEGTPVLFR
jgi:hypothetical protein